EKSVISEDELVRAIRKVLSGDAPGVAIGIGDDAAVVDTGRHHTILTTDMLVEAVHFELASASAHDIGHKALTVNVSDVAAMGGTAAYALATIALRRDLPVDVFEGVADGLIEAAERWRISVVGGDISEASELMVGVSLIGSITGSPVTRAGARPGDAICVTGTLGGAAGGLIALSKGLDAPDLVARQRRPIPRATEGPRLASAGISAMIDVSDGLAVDLGRVVEASGAGCEVDVDAIPVDPALDTLPGIDVVEMAVTGGEDFELLFTTDDLPTARAAVEGSAVTQIGVVTDGPATIGGTAIEGWRERGWEHLLDR
ncbi:MAG: thiamine-phosphate kinase, partial [Actinomycetota bacterium]